MKRTIVSYEKLPKEVSVLLKKKYPYGFDDESIITFLNSQGEIQKGVQVDLDGGIYLIKINEKVNCKFYSNDDIGGDFFNNYNDNQINYE